MLTFAGKGGGVWQMLTELTKRLKKGEPIYLKKIKTKQR